jgi:hypothetical protein
VDPNEIRKLIEHHRRVIRELEDDLARAEAGQAAAWVPLRFYTAYYVTSGLLIGIGAAWATLLLNMLGSLSIHGDAFKLLRVYGTFFFGSDAMETNRAAILMLTVGVHTLTGAVCGAPIHVVLSRWKPDLSLRGRVLAGAVLGVVMWLVNFYGVLSWLQPRLVGSAIILEEMPASVAAANHVAFAVLVVLMQPLGAFTVQRGAGDEEA